MSQQVIAKGRVRGLGPRMRSVAPRPLLSVLRWLKARLTAEGRMIHWLEQHRGEALLQRSSCTRADRHPEFFALARIELAGIAVPRILSFGCSTGEEACSLARALPSARVCGIDINPRSIAKARRSLPGDLRQRVDFECAAEPPADEAGYDAVFCLSVLRHGRLEIERIEDCSDLLPFTRFAEVIAALDHVLKPGGLLFLWGANFRFADTRFAAHYDPVAVPEKKAESGLFYGPDNQLIAGQTRNRDFVFRKRMTRDSATLSAPAERTSQ